MTFQPNILEGKTALITGGGTGICRGISLALAAHGCDVAITSRKKEHLEPTAREIEGLGRRAVAVPADVRDPVAVEAAVNEVMGAAAWFGLTAGLPLEQEILQVPTTVQHGTHQDDVSSDPIHDAMGLDDELTPGPRAR